ncbi:MAG: CRTAC1 family protein, partial [Myxococcales bacterium]|nr:CRTAC1 family protein [Myxococcales bacterium]
VVDVDGKAPLDLFFPQRAYAVSQLFMGQPDGTFVDEAALRGVSTPGDVVACLALDADGDGDEDLFLTGRGTLRLFDNDGGSFVDRSDALPPVDAMNLYGMSAAGDLDGDGDLDLVVAGYHPGSPFSEFINAGGVPNLLLVRRGDGTYESRSDLAPVFDEAEPTQVVSVGDLNEDGKPDIYVGNDFGHRVQNRVLAADESGVYQDRSSIWGLAYDASGHGIDSMGWSTADIDGDGKLDHVVSSFEGYSTSVFICNGTEFCFDQRVKYGTNGLVTTFRWGEALGDFDLDGWVDLFEAAGHLDLFPSPEGFTGPQVPNLMKNIAGKRFEVVLPSAQDGRREPLHGRGIALVDLDDDGRLDVVLAAADGPGRVLRNVRPPGGHFLRVLLVGLAPNTGAVGARVYLRAAGRIWTRERFLGEGFQGTFDGRLHFGLGAVTEVDLEVVWPNGEKTTLESVAVDQEIRITQE